MDKFRFFILILFAAITEILIFYPLNNESLSAAENNHLTIAYCKDSAPFHFTDKNGIPKGIIIDLWQLWTKKSNITIDFKAANWNETLGMVQTGKADVHAGLFYTLKRDSFLDYGIPLMKTDTQLFVHSALPTIKQLKDIVAYRIGVIEGDFVENYLKKKLPGGSIVPYPDYNSIMSELQKGNLKAFAADTPTGLFHLEKNGLLSQFLLPLEKPLYLNDFFFAVQEGNKALIELINRWMNLIRDEEKLTIYRRWVTKTSQEDDILIIGIDRSYSPLTFINTLGQPSGLLVDMWKAWAEKTGRKIQFRPSSWAETLDGLRAGEIDIHSGLSYSSEREKWIDFSTHIYETFSRIYHRTSDNQPRDINGYHPFIVGTMFESYQETEFRKRYPNINIRSYSNTQEMIGALLKDEIKAILQEEQLMTAAISRMGLQSDIKMRDEILFPSTIHAGVLKGKTNLLEQINQGFAGISNERLAALEKNWLPDSAAHFYKSKMKSVNLSPIEKTWLSRHPKVVFWNSDGFQDLGLSISETGEYSGFLWDMLQLVKQHMDIEIELKIAPLNDIIFKNRKGEVDAYLASDVNTYPRFGLLATNPYLSLYPVFYSNLQTASRINGYKDLSGRKVAVVEKHDYILTQLNEKAPDAVVMEFPDLISALGAVVDGSADVYGGFSTASYTIEKFLMTGVKTAFMDKSSPARLGYGIRKEWPELVSILNKAISAIPENEKIKIHHKWFKSEKTELALTAKEKEWIEKNPVIRVSSNPDWPPFDYTESGKPAGFSIEYMNLLAYKIGIQIDYRTNSWSDHIEMFKQGKIDVMHCLNYSQERAQFINFTQIPYFTLSNVAVVQEGAENITDIRQLYGKTLAAAEGWALTDYIRNEHPQIRLYLVNTSLEGLKAVQFSDADAWIDTYTGNRFLIDTHLMTNLKVGGEISGLGTFGFLDHYIGVRKDLVILRDIIQKAQDSITPEEELALKNKWKKYVRTVSSFDLTIEEKNWLKKHPQIRIGIDSSFFPFEFEDSDGNYSGVSSEYSTYFERQLGIKMSHTPGLTWKNVIDKARAKELDLIPCVAFSKEREDYLTFTKPYLSIPVVIFAQKHEEFIGGTNDLSDKRVAVVEGYLSHDKLKKDHPDLNLVLFPDAERALQALTVGRVDVFVNELASTSFLIDKLGLANLKVAASTKYKFDLSMGVRKDWPELAGILNKALASVTPEMAREFRGNWMSLTFEHKTEIVTLIKWIVPIAGTLGFILLVIFAWNRKLDKEISERKKIEAELLFTKHSVDYAADTVMWVHPETGRFAYVNHIACEQLSYTRDELMKMKVSDVDVDFPLEKLPHLIRQLKKTNSATFESRHQGKDGRLFDVEISVYLVEFEKQQLLAANAKDITERKKADKKLRQNMAELEQFNELAIGREEKMIELKKQINDLSIKLGREAKYEIVE